MSVWGTHTYTASRRPLPLHFSPTPSSFQQQTLNTRSICQGVTSSPTSKTTHSQNLCLTPVVDPISVLHRKSHSFNYPTLISYGSSHLANIISLYLPLSSASLYPFFNRQQSCSIPGKLPLRWPTASLPGLVRPSSLT